MTHQFSIETANDRSDTVYIVVTVLKTKNRYDLRMKPPSSLDPNQMAFKMSFKTDKKKWFNRIQDATGCEIDLFPPESIGLELEKDSIGRTTGEKVLSRLKDGK